MKKRIIDLQPQDLVWFCEPDSYKENKPLRVGRVEANGSKRSISLSEYGHDITLEGDEKPREMSAILKYQRMRNERTYLYFCNEVDWQRYRKAQGIKYLLGLIDTAKNAVNLVKRFRSENFADLNKNWLESEIIKLEKEIQ